MAPVVIEIVIFIGIIIFLITQVIIPMLFRVPLFPSFKFRKTAIKLEEATVEELEAAELLRISEIKKKAERDREDARYGFRKDQ